LFLTQTLAWKLKAEELEIPKRDHKRLSFASFDLFPGANGLAMSFVRKKSNQLIFCKGA